MLTKYFHACVRTEDGRSIASRGGCTTAYVVNDDNLVVGYAQAKCGPHDNFSKQQGRAKAGGRLKSPRYFKDILMPEDHPLNYYDVPNFLNRIKNKSLRSVIMFECLPELPMIITIIFIAALFFFMGFIVGRFT